MKVVFLKNKKGKVTCKYQARDGLVFSKKEFCEMYETKYMWRSK